jgi:hypothetical protein
MRLLLERAEVHLELDGGRGRHVHGGGGGGLRGGLHRRAHGRGELEAISLGHAAHDLPELVWIARTGCCQLLQCDRMHGRAERAQQHRQNVRKQCARARPGCCHDVREQAQRLGRCCLVSV